MLPGWNNKVIHFRDLMARKDIGVFQHSFTANQVPSHGTAIYKISEYKGKVQDDGWPNAG
jgi:hypothetical protein